MTDKNMWKLFCSGLGTSIVSIAIGIAIKAVMEVLLLLGSIGVLVFALLLIAQYKDETESIKKALSKGLLFFAGFILGYIIMAPVLKI